MEKNKVFISHQHNNDEIANKVLSALENSGLECFVDHVHIPDGQNWSERIEKELIECKYFLLINSKDTVESNGCYVEFDRSIKNNKKIVVLNIGNFKEDYKWEVLLASVQITYITESNVIDVIKEKIVPQFLISDSKKEISKSTISEFNRIEMDKLKNDASETYLRASFNDYIDLVIKDNERLSIIKYKHNCEYEDNLYTKLISLNKEEEKYIYCNSIATIDSAIDLINTEKRDDINYVFIRSINEIDSFNKIIDIITNNDNINFIVGINSESDYDFNNEINEVRCFLFDKMTNEETIDYLSQIEKEENLKIGGNLQTILLLPALYDFRTTKLLRIIINYIKQNCSSYNDADYNLTDIFDFYDKYLETNIKANEAFEKLINSAVKKKFNVFTLNEFGDDRNVLFENELVTKKGVSYKICNDEYFLHRVAICTFSTYGSNYSEPTITAIKDSIPYYIYLYYRETKELILDKFELDDYNLMKLLQLFVSEDDAFESIVKSRKYDKEIIAFINDINEKGLYNITGKVINVLEKNKIQPSEEFDYLSVKIEMHYNLTDELLETDEVFGNVLAEKAYICYQTDQFTEAGKLFEKAIDKMIDEDKTNYKLVFNYIEYLFDFGDYDKIEELLDYVDNDEIKNNDDLLIKYYYSKAELDGYRLELDMCLDNLEKCISLCEKNVNIGKMQIYYGEKGYYLMLKGKYEEAKKYNQTNLEIAKSLGNFNGMTVASINTAMCEFCLKNFDNMYRLVSYAAVYAKSVKNYWRYSEALMYLSLLIKNNNRVDNIDEIIPMVESDIFKTYIHILYSYYYYIKGNNDLAKNSICTAIDYSKGIKNLQLKELSKAWLNYIDSNNIGDIDSNIKKYMESIIESLNLLKKEDKIFTSPLEYYLYRELSSERLKLRSMKISDIPDIFEYSSNSECTKYVMFDKHKTFSDTAKFLANVYDENNSGTYMCWAIEHVLDNKVIGTIDLILSEKYNEIEIGYILNKNYWRKGYGKESVFAILKYCKDVLGLKSLLGVAFEVNQASRKLLESTGFVEFDVIENYHNKPLLKSKKGIAYRKMLN